VVSHWYVPMIRRELWTDDPRTLPRRLAIYATLWHVLKTLVLLFNPATPFLAEWLYQHVYRQLDPGLPESVNLERWPEPDPSLRDEELELAVEKLMLAVSLSYSARQASGLKRRWPLRKAVVVADETVIRALEGLKDLFLELANVKEAEFVPPGREPGGEGWSVAQEAGMRVFIYTVRDRELVGEGFMRDVARRVQALRRDMGFKPTEILDEVHISCGSRDDVELLRPFLDVLRDLVRAREVRLHLGEPAEPELKALGWRSYKIDGREVRVAIRHGQMIRP